MQNVIQDVKNVSGGKPKATSKSNVTGNESHSNAKNSHQNKVALLPVKAMQHQLEYIMKGKNKFKINKQKGKAIKIKKKIKWKISEFVVYDERV